MPWMPSFTVGLYGLSALVKSPPTWAPSQRTVLPCLAPVLLVPQAASSIETSNITVSKSEVTTRFPPNNDLGDEVEPMQSLLNSEWWVIAMTPERFRRRMSRDMHREDADVRDARAHWRDRPLGRAAPHGCRGSSSMVFARSARWWPLLSSACTRCLGGATRCHTVA